VRLEGNVTFPLLPLKTNDPDSNKVKFELVLPNENGEYEKVQVVIVPNNLRMETFTADKSEKQVVSVKQKNRFLFKTGKRQNYFWVGELKFAHAQRIINQFASQISRVGLDESEWLRRSK
jgi:hypothetical protein